MKAIEPRHCPGKKLYLKSHPIRDSKSVVICECGAYWHVKGLPMPVKCFMSYMRLLPQIAPDGFVGGPKTPEWINLEDECTEPLASP